MLRKGLLLTLLLCLTISSTLFAQDWDRNAQDPVATEIWNPRVPKVTPGASWGAAPSDAIILLDGSNLDNWESTADGQSVGWELKDGVLTVVPGQPTIQTKQAFGSVQLHVEWRSPSVLEGEGQGRGNSGIFLMGKYELQVLDSYSSDTYSNGQAGAIYKQYPPLVNATKEPGEWQMYDIIFMAPVFSDSGSLLRPATITAFHNGVLIQNNKALMGPVEYRGLAQYRAHADRLPLQLQEHGNPVSYRNIWIREL